MARRVWKSPEIAWLRENYHKLGAEACAEHFGGTTPAAVTLTARRYGIAQRAAEIAVPSSDWIDAVIRRCHVSGSQNPWLDASRQVSRTPRWVRHRAGKLGLRIRNKDWSHWTKGETDFVLKRLHWAPERIASEMQENGWKRTEHSVRHFLRRRGLAGTDTSHMTATAAAAALGVSLNSLRRWIDVGMLIAERRNPDAEGDRQVAVSEEDLAAFILLHPERIDFVKIERAQTKTWFLDLISRFPQPPNRMDDYLRRQIESVHTFRPDFDSERIATTLGIEERTVRETLSHARERDLQRARARARRADAREAA